MEPRTRELVKFSTQSSSLHTVIEDFTLVFRISNNVFEWFQSLLPALYFRLYVFHFVFHVTLLLFLIFRLYTNIFHFSLHNIVTFQFRGETFFLQISPAPWNDAHCSRSKLKSFPVFWQHFRGTNRSLFACLMSTLSERASKFKWRKNNHKITTYSFIGNQKLKEVVIIYMKLVYVSFVGRHLLK